MSPDHPADAVRRHAIALCNQEEAQRTRLIHGPFIGGNAPCPRHMKEARLSVTPEKLRAVK